MIGSSASAEDLVFIAMYGISEIGRLLVICLFVCLIAYCVKECIQSICLMEE